MWYWRRGIRFCSVWLVQTTKAKAKAYGFAFPTSAQVWTYWYWNQMLLWLQWFWYYVILSLWAFRQGKQPPCRRVSSGSAPLRSSAKSRRRLPSSPPNARDQYRSNPDFRARARLDGKSLPSAGRKAPGGQTWISSISGTDETDSPMAQGHVRGSAAGHFATLRDQPCVTCEAKKPPGHVKCGGAAPKLPGSA